MAMGAASSSSCMHHHIDLKPPQTPAAAGHPPPGQAASRSCLSPFTPHINHSHRRARPRPPTAAPLSLPCTMAEAQQQRHPVFRDIERGRLEEVQQRVVANAAVLEERLYGSTPLMWAIISKKLAIALWLIQHRGQHDVNKATAGGSTALHDASMFGPLEVVQALVAAGANPAALAGRGFTPLMHASSSNTDIVAFLLQLPAGNAGIDHISQSQCTALSEASFYGHQPVVQLLLDAGADPTIPAGEDSPLNRALDNNHHATAALLRDAINEAKRARECVAWLGKGKKEMFEDLLVKVQEHLVHAWADKGPAAVL